ncbi:MAG TPA: PhnD/SsuA/transferrin family substrate-binding protein [Bradyrhizobium sp.]|jgi:ABC-type phosphate/phosphonate transport system substrate-binding protein|uniref:phosphate/phosphite/phosphonate ABC transporter substrate-binding protein n=1 Tax=Bradyrhizobium sp. TaxID=376 RepID=UPI002D19CCF4|nr:PhnD/SsuA/transferrin family substrate-binding protein [Bradyrhizobium sp.]HTB03914.1 PhnD/SsuA/transferrin family substrate-binding protein [Bradyrhizobium sp.]
MPYVANARMYSVNPAAAAAWKELFGWLARESRVELRVIDHAFPLPLADLWSRDDLACAFMCGFPYALAARKPQPVAAPVPVGAPIAGRPVYATRLLVKADSRFCSLEDTFGGRLGYTVEDSHSGYNALRHHLLPYYRKRGERLYRESIGPMFTPRRVIDALLADDIDIGPLDSYALDLMLRHEPDLGQKIRAVATTDIAPIPLLVASADCPDEVVSPLQAALAKFADCSDTADLRDRLCLERFVPVEADDYSLTARWDDEARKAGYSQPG